LHIQDTPVIDFHGHVGGWGSYATSDDPDGYLRMMDAAGVDKACVNCIFHGDARRSNEVTSAYVGRHPDRFIGVAFVTPGYPDEAIPTLEHAFDVLGMRSLKVYPPFFGGAIDDLAYMPIFEWCDDRALVVMSHSSNTGPDDFAGTLTHPSRFMPLARKFPRVRWVLAHSGNARQGNAEAVEAARAYPNVFLETCSTYTAAGTIEYLVEGAGEDRVIFGVDMPLLDPRSQLGKIVTADISDTAKKKVLGLNAIRLLGLEE